jgi:PhnB protein
MGASDNPRQEDDMSKAKSAVPEGFRSLTPYLIVKGAKSFLDFIQNAFGAREKYLMSDADGTVRHAEAWIGDSIVEFADASQGWSAMPAGLHYYVKNADEVYARALKAGGASLYEPTNRDYGDREAGVRDPAGNFWFIATHIGGKSYRPEILQDLNTHFSVKDAWRFLEFLERALGAEVIQREASGSGTIQHAKVRIGDTVVELGEGRAPWGPRAVALHYYVENCDAVFARGLANGCKELQPMTNQVYGDRSGSLLDSWGNHWYIASHLEDLTTEEIAQRAAAAGR